MNEKYTLLIADRNPHVRALLKREMMGEGYRVRLAGNGRELLGWVFCPEPVDLLILDPDLPDVDEAYIARRLHNRIPRLPVILHTYPDGWAQADSPFKGAFFVEKEGESIEGLKKVVARILASPEEEEGAPWRPAPRS